MQLIVAHSVMLQLSCDRCQAFKQGSQNTRTTQYSPTSPHTSYTRVQHHTFPADDLLECTSHITPSLQYRCLTSWGKLPHYKTFPTSHTMPALSLVLPLSPCLSHTNTHRQRQIKTTPPTPTFSTATTWWYALNSWVHTKHCYMPRASMQHHETTQRAAGEAHSFTLHWASVSPQSGFAWVVVVTFRFWGPIIKEAKTPQKEYFHMFILSPFRSTHSKKVVNNIFHDDLIPRD